MIRPGIPFVVSAPSGTGKTTVCRQLVAQDANLVFSISHTTRRMRPGEVDGHDYHFVSAQRFHEMVEEGGFLEHAEYAGHLYGTSWASVDGPLAEGRDVLLEIEVQGASQIRERRPDARFVFLLPPSQALLEARLRNRGSDSEDAIHHRLALSGREVKAVHLFDYAVVNDDLACCVDAVREIIEAERSSQTADVRARFARDVTLARLQGEFAF